MIISVTERGNFRRCRRLWDYTSFSRQGLTPIVHTVPLMTGTLHHQTLEDWANKPTEDPEKLYVARAVVAQDKVRNDYKAAIGYLPNESEMNDFYESVDFGLAMIRNYRDYWGSPIEKGFQLIKAEQTLLLPIPDTEHQLECTLDGIVTDGYKLYVLERKTYNARPNEHTLRFNDQFVVYMWALRTLGIGEVAGIAYDGSWRRKSVPKGKTMDDMFLRVPLLRTPYEVDYVPEMLRLEANDMYNATIYPNRRWEGCHDCGFRRVCDAQTQGLDFEGMIKQYYTKRERTAAYQDNEDAA